MELKRIIARDSRAANEKAIQLYGPDVLVISSQRVDSQTELIVAIDTAEAPVAPEVAAPAPSAGRDQTRDQARFQAFSDVFKVSVENPPPVEAPADSDWEPAALRLAQTQAQAQAQAVAPVQATLPATPALAPAAVPAAFIPPSIALAPEPQPLPQAVLAAQQEAAELLRSRDTVELLRQEIAALRQEFNLNRQVSMWQSGQGLSPEMTHWFAHMQELGVPASLRTLMVDAANGCDTVGEAWPLIHKTLIGALKRRKSGWPQKGVHALVGPSGAGKTLMVARMAMAATAKVRAEDMAIISMADAKAGAWSQLQVLAAQSGVACYRAADVATLDMLLQELSHLSVIWVDTPGTDFMQQAQALQTTSPTVALHAVLPLDATVTNVRKIFDTAEVKWTSVMLTKLDEAAHPWHVLKALCDRALDVSAVGASHQVRVAPQAFDGQAIVDLAMEGLCPQGQPVKQQEEPVRKPRRRTTASKTRVLAKAAVVNE